VSEKKKDVVTIDADSDDRFDQLVPVTGGLIPTEVVEDDEVDRIRYRIQDITRRVDESRLELGALFFRVRLNAIYVRWTSPVTGKKYQTWEEYVDTESAFSVRSIQHMVAMWWWFSELNAFPQIKDRINGIGWGKARILVGLADDENYEAWFALAESVPQAKLAMSARAAMDKVGIPRRPSVGVARPDPKGVLPTQPASASPDVATATPVDAAPVNTDPVKTEMSAVPEEASVAPLGITEPQSDRKGVDVPTDVDIGAYAEKRTMWKCLMDETQRLHVENAVKVTYDVLKDSGSMKERPASAEIAKGLALEMMATHFLSFYTGSSAVNKEMRTRIFFADIVRGLEKNFGVDVVVIDDKSGEILHGIGDDLFAAVERKLGVTLVALKNGTNDCVYGYEALTRMAGNEGEES
jgi:hypothetical protein